MSLLLFLSQSVYPAIGFFFFSMLQLQLLPPSVFKMIVSMLDSQSLEEAKKVNSYWASIIESTLKDKAAREMLDNVIYKISSIQVKL